MSDSPTLVCIEDRYGGTYSGGAWLAMYQSRRRYRGYSRLWYLTSDLGPWGNDTTARKFWHKPPPWVAVGDTPEAAIAALKAKS